MKEIIIDVVIENISIIGYEPFLRCSSLTKISFQKPMILIRIQEWKGLILHFQFLLLFKELEEIHFYDAQV